jgi:hypothetical protein
LSFASTIPSSPSAGADRRSLRAPSNRRGKRPTHYRRFVARNERAIEEVRRASRCAVADPCARPLRWSAADARFRA